MGNVGFTLQHDSNTYKFGRRKRLSKLDRKIYKIAHQQLGTRQLIARNASFGSTTGPNTQLVFFQSTYGNNNASQGIGDLKRIHLAEGSPVNVKYYLKCCRFVWRFQNVDSGVVPVINESLIVKVYKIKAGKAFDNLNLPTLNSIYSTGAGVGPAASTSPWNPFLVSDKTSEYKLSIVDMTEFKIAVGDTVEYKDNHYMPFTVASDTLDNAASFTAVGDNNVGRSYHYLAIVSANDPTAIGPTQPLNLTNYFEKHYTYEVEGVATAGSNIVIG
jgi:hypothetical protein